MTEEEDDSAQFLTSLSGFLASDWSEKKETASYCVLLKRRESVEKINSLELMSMLL